MTKQNIVEPENKKFQNSRWPAWLPYPSCWLKSLVLIIFLRLITFVAEILVKVGYNVANFASSPEILAIFIIITVLCPMPIIAFSHHFLHLICSRFIPEIQAPEIGIVKGLIPNLMSWWEGIYAWLVITLSTLTSFLVGTIVLPLLQLSYATAVERYTPFQQTIIVIFGFMWLTQAALIYQIEYLVRHRLISVYSKK
jgi:hypothetical protein